MRDRSPSDDSIMVFAVFVATWIVLGIGLFVASWKLDAATKRQWFPFVIVVVGILFVGFTTLLLWLQPNRAASLWILAVLIPVVVGISYLNITHTKFCDACNATLIDQNWFGHPMKFCPKCGAPLDGAQPPR